MRRAPKPEPAESAKPNAAAPEEKQTRAFVTNFTSGTPEAIKERWGRVLARIAVECGPVTVISWFERLVVNYSVTSETLTLEAPSAFHRDYIVEKLGIAFQRATCAEFPENPARITVKHQHHEAAGAA